MALRRILQSQVFPEKEGKLFFHRSTRYETKHQVQSLKFADHLRLSWLTDDNALCVTFLTKLLCSQLNVAHLIDDLVTPSRLTRLSAAFKKGIEYRRLLTGIGD
jgi:hypothetical protein